MDNTYWNSKGTHQAEADALTALVPDEGWIRGKKNAKLEIFRKASNAYYDIFNNGGCNRRALIRTVFKIQMSNYIRWRGGYQTHDWDAIFRTIEPIMDEIVLAAATEQNVGPAVMSAKGEQFASAAAVALGDHNA